jgi:methyl-accepting chemotaxis protein
MKNMKIKTKLITGFLIIAVLTAIVGGVGIYSLIKSSNETQLLNARATMAIISGRLSRNVNQQRAAYLGTVAFDEIGDYERAGTYTQTLSTLEGEFDSMVTELENSLTTDEGKRLLSDIKTNYSQFAGLRDAIIGLMEEISAARSTVAAPVAVAEGAEGAIATGGAATTAAAEAGQVRDALTAVASSAAPLVDSVDALTDFIEDITDEQAANVAADSKRTTAVSGVILAIALVAAVVLGLYISGIIARPINLMMGFLKQVGETGNLTFTDEDWRKAREATQYKDEISQSLAAFVKMLEQLVHYGEALQSVAARDLTVSVNTLGARDTMGAALTTMMNNLNGMFDEINTSANQVSGGSQQIANGAQSLAQGATEQAASVEQLSAAISDVSGSIKEAAESAKRAAELSDGIRSKAEEGSERMNAMMAAVQEINDASQSIGKVIKVIDDIAFQTNILALNAAVEAARAGAAGRGFAVVAEEVRNLAAKSAEAAQDTESLIANSISKASLGVKIAGETNESLIEIVDGVIASSQISDEIAASADRQSAAITQITTGIDQVAQVVQQNSATAEESAAASEELSGQSAVLNGLIGQFKLRNMSGAYLPPAGGKTLASGRSGAPEIILDAKEYGGEIDKY